MRENRGVWRINKKQTCMKMSQGNLLLLYVNKSVQRLWGKCVDLSLQFWFETSTWLMVMLVVGCLLEHFKNNKICNIRHT